MGNVSQALVVAGPLVLTIMGAVISIAPPTSKKTRLIWIIAFVAVCATTYLATYHEMQSGNQTNGDTNNRVRSMQSQYNKLNGQFNSLTDKYGKIASALQVDPKSTLEEILARINLLITKTFHVRAGEVFYVPVVSAHISAEISPRKVTTIKLPAKPFVGEEITVKVGATGSELGGYVNVEGNGNKIDGNPNFPMNFALSAYSFRFVGTHWDVI